MLSVLSFAEGLAQTIDEETKENNLEPKILKLSFSSTVANRDDLRMAILSQLSDFDISLELLQKQMPTLSERIQYTKTVKNDHLLAIVWVEQNEKEWLLYLSKPQSGDLFVRSIQRTSSSTTDHEGLASVLRSSVGALLIGELPDAKLVVQREEKKIVEHAPPTTLPLDEGHRLVLTLGVQTKSTLNFELYPSLWIDLRFKVFPTLYSYFHYSLSSLTKRTSDFSFSLQENHFLLGTLFSIAFEGGVAFHFLFGGGISNYSTVSESSKNELLIHDVNGWRPLFQSYIGVEWQGLDHLAVAFDLGFDSYWNPLLFRRQDKSQPITGLGLSPQIRLAISWGVF